MSTSATIYNAVRGAGMPAPLSALIVAQAQVETANFTSHVFLSCNNCFGYKATGTAPKCVVSTEGDYYKKYTSISDSAREIAAWIKRRQSEGKFPADLTTITTPQQYASLLKQSGFYGSSESAYASAMAGYFQNFKAPTSQSGLFIALALLTALWINHR